MRSMFTSLTNNVISRIALGRKLDGTKYTNLVNAFVDAFNVFTVGSYVPWLAEPEMTTKDWADCGSSSKMNFGPVSVGPDSAEEAEPDAAECWLESDPDDEEAGLEVSVALGWSRSVGMGFCYVEWADPN
ncbi:hypothetical protein L1987_48181 [Smallanthus sonchifolius]|uniref:Uncharacterized protein n=1 Tax=Smallanthus sonchifolius TaxID=185202 RepID=A0ACB9FSC5_9ASTR|nr:hypothetical protein L1987_48181 [Smallanthus sonchifolius]